MGSDGEDVVFGRPKTHIERMYDTLIEIRPRLIGQLRPDKKASEVAKWVWNEIINSGV